MARVARLYVPLDASFPDDDKIVDAGERAGWLYIHMLCKCKAIDTDGVLTRAQIAKLGVPGWQPRLAALVDVGAVVESTDTPGAYQIPAWLSWNKSREQRAADRAKDRSRKADKKGTDSDA